MDWNELTMAERAKLIKTYVKNGVYDLSEMKEHYNSIQKPPSRPDNTKPDFVRRLEDPNRKSIPDWANPDNIATHKMAWATEDNHAVVYPNVQNISGKLVDFTRPPYSKWAGYDSAVQRGDTLHMTPKQADNFTRNYKKFYPNFYAYGGYTSPWKPPEEFAMTTYEQPVYSTQDNTRTNVAQNAVQYENAKQAEIQNKLANNPKMGYITASNKPAETAYSQQVKMDAAANRYYANPQNLFITNPNVPVTYKDYMSGSLLTPQQREQGKRDAEVIKQLFGEAVFPEFIPVDLAINANKIAPNSNVADNISKASLIGSFFNPKNFFKKARNLSYEKELEERLANLSNEILNKESHSNTSNLLGISHTLSEDNLLKLIEESGGKSAAPSLAISKFGKDGLIYSNSNFVSPYKTSISLYYEPSILNDNGLYWPADGMWPTRSDALNYLKEHNIDINLNSILEAKRFLYDKNLQNPNFPYRPVSKERAIESARNLNDMYAEYTPNSIFNLGQAKHAITYSENPILLQWFKDNNINYDFNEFLKNHSNIEFKNGGVINDKRRRIIHT